MSKIVYKIESVNGKDGKKKDNIYGYGDWFIKVLAKGQAAILIDLSKERDGKSLKTSTVEEIFIWENNIKITTLNSVYYLEPVRGENK